MEVNTTVSELSFLTSGTVLAKVTAFINDPDNPKKRVTVTINQPIDASPNTSLDELKDMACSASVKSLELIARNSSALD